MIIALQIAAIWIALNIAFFVQRLYVVQKREQGFGSAPRPTQIKTTPMPPIRGRS